MLLSPTVTSNDSCGCCCFACWCRLCCQCGLQPLSRIRIHCGNSFYATNSIWVMVGHIYIHIRCGGPHVLHVCFGGLFCHLITSVRLTVVVDLGLERRDCTHERLHLFHHALVLLGGVSHVAKLLLHMLFRDGFGIHGCLGISLHSQSVDNLSDEGGWPAFACQWKPRESVVTAGGLLLIAFCASLKWVLKAGQEVWVFFWRAGNQTYSGHKIVIFRMTIAKLVKCGGFCGQNSPNVDLWRIL